MNCYKCGAELMPGAMFCGACGTKQKVPDGAGSMASGFHMPDENGFYCSPSLEDQSDPFQAAPSPEHKVPYVTPVMPNPTPIMPNPAPKMPNPTPVMPNPAPKNPNPAPFYGAPTYPAPKAPVYKAPGTKTPKAGSSSKYDQCTIEGISDAVGTLIACLLPFVSAGRSSANVFQLAFDKSLPILMLVVLGILLAAGGGIKKSYELILAAGIAILAGAIIARTSHEVKMLLGWGGSMGIGFWTVVAGGGFTLFHGAKGLLNKKS